VRSKQRFFILLAGCFAAFVCSGCATSRGAGRDTWGDAALIAEQRAEIEQLQRDIIEMGEYQREISGRIDRITGQLVDGLGRCDTIEDIHGEIDRFVRKLIEENSKLREVQPADRGEDGATGQRFGSGIRNDRRAGEETPEKRQHHTQNGYSHRVARAGDYNGYRNRRIEALRENNLALAMATALSLKDSGVSTEQEDIAVPIIRFLASLHSCNKCEHWARQITGKGKERTICAKYMVHISKARDNCIDRFPGITRGELEEIVRQYKDGRCTMLLFDKRALT